MLRTIKKWLFNLDEWLSARIIDKRTKKPKWDISQYLGFVEGVLASLAVALFFHEHIDKGIIVIFIAVLLIAYTIRLVKMELPLPASTQANLEVNLIESDVLTQARTISSSQSIIQIGRDLYTNLIIDCNRLLAKESTFRIIKDMLINRMRRCTRLTGIDTGGVFYFNNYQNAILRNYIGMFNRELSEAFFRFKESPWQYVGELKNVGSRNNCDILIVAIFLDTGLNDFIDKLELVEPTRIYCLTLFIPAIVNVDHSMSKHRCPSNTSESCQLIKTDFKGSCPYRNESCKRLLTAFPRIDEFISLIPPKDMSSKISIGLAQKVKLEFE